MLGHEEANIKVFSLKLFVLCVCARARAYKTGLHNKFALLHTHTRARAHTHTRPAAAAPPTSSRKAREGKSAFSVKFCSCGSRFTKKEREKEFR